MSVLQENESKGRSFLGTSSVVIWVIMIVIFAAGLGIRLYDLTDLPLDFHPTRQLHSALISRGMYYQTAPDIPDEKRAEAVQQWKREQVIEPQVMEILTAQVYRIAGGEYLWIPRLLAILFWCLGGIGMYLLAKELVSKEGAIIATGFYMLLPYGAIASRSFQPEPLMIALMIFSLWAFYRWQNTSSWKWAILTGFFTGLAVFVKTVVVFPLLFGMGAVILYRQGFIKAVRDSKLWTILIMTALPTAAYYIHGVFIEDYLVGQFTQRFFPELLTDLHFYIRWYLQIDKVIGLVPLMLALIGVLLFSVKRARVFMFGLFVGYVVYGMTLPYHIASHDYYQLPLIPIVALALAPVADWLGRSLVNLHSGLWVRFFVVFVLLVGMGGCLWDIRDTLKDADYRPEAALWRDLATMIGENSVIGLVQDYGYRMEYWGWVIPAYWPATGDMQLKSLSGNQTDIDSLFQQEASGKDYFLVTMFDDFERQPEVKKYLYAHYPVSEGNGYILFDLRNPIKQ
jgi:hypothetical protein